MKRALKIIYAYRNFEVGFIDVIALGDHFECCAIAYIITFHEIHPMNFDTSWGQIFRLCFKDSSLKILEGGRGRGREIDWEASLACSACFRKALMTFIAK